MINSLWIAVKTYSRLPAPEVEWNERNMRYAMGFFPVIGIVIGAAEFLWLFIAGLFHCGSILSGAVAAVIPILITGAIHMDGFCDTVDALSSHQSRERKLEILKDSHTGAFAVIFACVWMIVYFACFTGITSYGKMWIVGFGFILSRSLSGLAAVTFRSARSNGMLNAFSGTAEKKTVRNVLIITACLSVVLMIISGGWTGLIAAAVNGLVFLYYRYMSYKQFGGITGDLAGWFLQMAELSTAIVVALSANL